LYTPKINIGSPKKEMPKMEALENEFLFISGRFSGSMFSRWSSPEQVASVFLQSMEAVT